MGASAAGRRHTWAQVVHVARNLIKLARQRNEATRHCRSLHSADKRSAVDRVHAASGVDMQPSPGTGTRSATRCHEVPRGATRCHEVPRGAKSHDQRSGARTVADTGPSFGRTRLWPPFSLDPTRAVTQVLTRTVTRAVMRATTRTATRNLRRFDTPAPWEDPRFFILGRSLQSDRPRAEQQGSEPANQ